MTQERLIDAIATMLVAEGCNNTSQGDWVFDFEEIADTFNITIERVEKLINKVDEALFKYAAVAETDIDFKEKTIDVTFYTDYCGLSKLEDF